MDFYMDDFQNNFKNMSDEFEVFGENIKQKTVRGFFTGKNHEIQLVPGSSIEEGNTLIDANGKKYLVDEANPLPDNQGFMIKYETEYSQSKKQESSINIGTVNGGASFGDNNNNVFNSSVNDLKDIKNLLNSYSDVSDKQKDDLLNLLNDAKESNVSMSKGHLSKFKELFIKHSDLGEAVGVFVIKLLTSNL